MCLLINYSVQRQLALPPSHLETATPDPRCCPFTNYTNATSMAKLTLHYLMVSLLITVLSLACTTSDDRGLEPCNIDATTAVSSDLPCDTEISLDLIARWTIHVGTVTLYRDEDVFVVSYETTNDRVMDDSHIFLGACDAVPLDANCEPAIDLFPYRTVHSPPVNNYTYEIPASELEDCNCFIAQATTHLPDNGGVLYQSSFAVGGNDLPGNQWGSFAILCPDDCESSTGGNDDPPCTIDVGDFRTQTQGGWGANPNGQNPGTYLYANFDSAFPDGLTIGCDFKITLTTADAITRFLPQGGGPLALSMDYTDPTDSGISTLAGQLTAAMLSVGFDLYDPDFGAADEELGALAISSGTFAGWSVNQLIAEANLGLGGCATIYNLSDINDALSGINESFVDGEMSSGYLECP